MAEILPQEFENKTKGELFQDIVALSNYVTKLRNEIQELQAQVKLQNGEIIKKRGEILKLKSAVGFKNIEINQIKQDKENIIDITDEADRDNSTQ